MNFSLIFSLCRWTSGCAGGKNRAGRTCEEVPPSGFPLGLENLENLEKWEGIFQSGKSQGILNRLEKSGKVRENHTKYWKN